MKILKIASAAVVFVALGACGGKVVVGAGGGGGGSTSSSTGTAGCDEHGDCPSGLCIFATGTCAAACESEFCPSCAAGTVCDDCASSSCPNCDDCRAACVPTSPGRCDDDDPCPAGQVCIFDSRTCAQACQTDSDCGDFNFCSPCVTGSCCGCENCVSACVGGE